MSIIHADGFSLYGTGATSRTNIVQGVWAQIDTTSSCETTNPRAPGTHHLRIGNTTTDFVRRVLDGGSLNTVGLGAAHYLSALPDANNKVVLAQWRDGSNAAQCSVTVTSTGVIQVRTGNADGSVVAESSAPVLTAGAYNHVEMRVTVHPSAGAIEIRVNGETVVTATGINTAGTGSAGTSQYVIGNPTGAALSTGGVTWDVADVIVWDTSGSDANDFLGDCQCLTWYPTSDESASDWTRNTGSSDFDAINDVTPDGDSTYVEASAAAQVSEYGVTNVPATTSDIIAVITQPMLRKTDAGSGSVVTSLLSADIGSPLAPAESNGAEVPVTQTYTYYPQVHATDPATGVRWTPASWNAARLRLERTA